MEIFMIKIKFFALIILLSVSCFCQKKKMDKIIPDDVDIVKSSFMGCPISELSIDKLTDLLGRPDLASEHKELKGRITLDYYSLGLSFVFVKTEKNPIFECYGFTVYLIKYFKDESKIFFPFKGKITRNISANWKKKDLLKYFEDFHELFYEDEEGFASSKELERMVNEYHKSNKMSRPFPSIDIRKKDFKVQFYYDDLTMFLRNMVIWKNFNNSIQNVEGNSNSIKIGEQSWMTENLDVDRFRNGELIPEAKTNEEWENAGKESKPVWCLFENNYANGKKYGKYYNWYAVNDKRGLAPKGWHIPTKTEFEKLKVTINNDGNVLKALGQGIENGAGTNTSGFSALLAGYRDQNGIFHNFGTANCFWSSTDSDSNRVVTLFLGYTNNGTGLGLDYKEFGFSVRCLKD